MKEKSNTSRTHFHHFPREISKRIADVIQLQLAERSTDSDSEKRTKSEIRRGIADYISDYAKVQNEEEYPSSGSRKIRQYSLADVLTVETLDRFLSCTGWSCRFFLEQCLKENLARPVEDCIYPNILDVPWTGIGWPTAEMAEICGILEQMLNTDLDNIENIIISLLPQYYTQFFELLGTDSMEYGDSKPGRRDEETPGGTDLSSPFTAERKADNMGNRIYETIRYKNSRQNIISTILADNGMDPNISRLSKKNHFWYFSLQDYKTISELFKITPKWMFFGMESKSVLTTPRVEQIMFMFSMLQENEQHVAAAAIRAYREVQKRGEV